MGFALARATPILSIVLVMVVVTACSGSDEASEPTTGAGIYRAVCATCHGRDGNGFVGPSLHDIAVRYPDVETQVALVAGGRGQMPGFANDLSARQVRAVVDYTRTRFASTSTSTTVFVGPTLPSGSGTLPGP